MNSFVNYQVVNWAGQSLPQTVEVKLKNFNVLLAICIGLLGLIFVGIALLFYATAILTIVGKGATSEVVRNVIGGTFFLGVFVAICGGLLLLGKVTRRNFAKYISVDGVQTRNGQKLRWEDLYYLDYKKRGGRINPHQLAASAAREALFIGVEKVTVELVFAGGKAVVPPLIKNQPEILALLNSMPVQRRDYGNIRV